MKKYQEPMMHIFAVRCEDIIATSPVTQGWDSSWKDANEDYDFAGTF